jgi:site-specific recombinase XerD
VTSLANAALLESWGFSLHDLRPRTQALYLEEAKRFADWLTDHGRPGDAPGDLLAVSRSDAEAWLTDLRRAGLAPATIRSRWIAMRNFYRWAADEKEVDVSPFANVKVTKPDPPIVPVLPLADLRALLKACDGADFEARRDVALIRLMLATGMRLTETANLRVDELDLPNRVVIVRGKGGKDRLVRFDPATAAAIDRYKRVRARHKAAGAPWLWLGWHGHFTAAGIPSMLVKRSKKAGIGHVHPHQLRHTWASRYLAAGGQEGDLQRLGGWQNADVMRRYGSAAAVDRALAAYDNVNLMGDL